MENGFHFLSGDAQECTYVITKRGSSRAIEFRRGQLAKLRFKAQRLLPKLNAIRVGLNIGRFQTGSRLHFPLLKDRLQARAMGGAGWRDQFFHGSRSLGVSVSRG